MARLDDRIDRVFDPRTAKVLASSLDVHTVGELLRHYPRRYEQRGELTDLANLRDGEHVTVLAQIKAVTTRPMRNRRGKLTEVTVTDGRGTLTLAFFRQPWREKELKPGLHGLFAGQVSSYGRKRQLIHPDCELLGETDPGTELAAEHAAEIIPVYPATSQLPSWKIAKAIRTVLDTLDIADDPLPAAVRDRHGLLSQAGRAARHPPPGRVRRQGPGQAAAEVGRGVRAAGRAGPAAAGRGRAARHLAHPAPRQAARCVRRPAPVPADRRAARRGRGDHDRAVPGAPDAPAAAGRGGLRQDPGRGARHAPGGGRRRPGGAARAHRGAGPAALPVADPAARPARPGRRAGRRRPGHPGRAAHRLAGRQGPPGRAGRRGLRRGRHRDRHAHPALPPGPAGRPGGVQGPGPGGDRRAAPVRRAAARRATREGPRQPPARAGHDGHPDPPDGGHDRLRRPGRMHAQRAAGRPHADHQPRGARRGEAALPRAHLAAAPRGSGRRRPGLRRVPPDRPGRRAFRPNARAG